MPIISITRLSDLLPRTYEITFRLDEGDSKDQKDIIRCVRNALEHSLGCSFDEAKPRRTALGLRFIHKAETTKDSGQVGTVELLLTQKSDVVIVFSVKLIIDKNKEVFPDDLIFLSIFNANYIGTRSRPRSFLSPW